MGNIFENPPALLAVAIVILLAIGLHEYSHAKFADMAGDPTPRYYGRVTLNLFNHFDLFGTIMIFVTLAYGYGLGWGRPVPMDPSKMHNPRWDHFVAVLAGPVSNILQAIVYAMLFRGIAAVDPSMLQSTFMSTLLIAGVLINLGLCFFNLFPLGPLDGMWLIGTFLPEPTRHSWTRWNLTVGQFVFLGLVIFGQVSKIPILGTVIGVPVDFMARILLGGAW